MELILLLLIVGAVMLVLRARRASSGVPVNPSGAMHPPRALEGSPGSGRAVLAVARREAVLLVRHPALVIGIVLLTPFTFMLGLQGSEAVLHQDDVATQWLLVPLAWSALLAANLTALRTRRSGGDELMGATAVPPGSRTAALLVACLVTVPVSIVATAALVVIARWQGGRGLPRLEVMAVGPLIVLGAAMLGVAVARWLPWAVFGWVAVVVTFIVEANLGYSDPVFRWLHFAVNGGDAGFDWPQYQYERHAWHLVYLLGGVLLVAGVALLRSPPTALRTSVAGAGLVLVVAGAVIQVAPPSARDAQLLASRLEDPQLHQECTELDGVTYCHWSGYGALLEEWRVPVDAVLAGVPAPARPASGELVMVQRPELTVRAVIHPSVRSLVDPRRAFPRDDTVSLPFDWPRDTWAVRGDEAVRDFDLAFATSLWAVGLPDRPWWDESSTDDVAWATRPLQDPAWEDDRTVILPGSLTTCLAGGEARTVTALWLAARATPNARSALRGLVTGNLPDGGTRRPLGAQSQPFDLSARRDLFTSDTYQPTVLSVLPRFGTVVIGADVAAADALLALPDEQVLSVLEEHWDEVLQPDTPASQLLAWSGVAAPWLEDVPASGASDLTTPLDACRDLPAAASPS